MHVIRHHHERVQRITLKFALAVAQSVQTTSAISGCLRNSGPFRAVSSIRSIITNAFPAFNDSGGNTENNQAALISVANVFPHHRALSNTIGVR